MFEEIKEQNKAKETLLDHINNNKINHCYIFFGKDGTGRLPTALKFAQSLVCENNNACDECTNCKQFEKRSVADFMLVDVPEGKKEIPVDAVREIISEINIKPYIFRKKIVIINNADKMNTNAQNAILKALEEPPSYVVFILIVSNMLALLPTIISRGNVINFSGLSDKAIKDILKEKYEVDIPASLLSLCSGSAKTAYEITADEKYKEIRKEILSSFYRFVTSPTEKNQLMLYSVITKYENEKDFFINIMYTVITDMLVADNKDILKNKDFDYDTQKTISKKKAYAVLNIISQMQLRLNTNVSFSLCVFSSLDEMRRILNERTIS